MADILVRNVPESVIATLKLRAASNRRSLQQELLEVLEEAADQGVSQTPAEIAHRIRTDLARKGITFTDSTPLIRDDRRR